MSVAELTPQHSEYSVPVGGQISVDQQLAIPLQPEICGNPKKSAHTSPAGKTGYLVGRYPIQERTINWLDQKHAVLDGNQIARRPDMLSCPEDPLTDEAAYYATLQCCIFPSVNAASRALGHTGFLRMSKNISGCKLRGLPDWYADVRNPDRSPGRVISTAEGKVFSQQHFSSGEHWYQLLGPGSSKAERKKAAKFAAQALMYMDQNLRQYGEAFTPSHAVFIFRPAETSSKAVFFSDTFEIGCSNPTVRQMLAYHLYQAGKTPNLPVPKAWTNQTLGRSRWVTKAAQAARGITWPKSEARHQQGLNPRTTRSNTTDSSEKNEEDGADDEDIVMSEAAGECPSQPNLDVDGSEDAEMEEQGGTAMEGFEALGAEIGQREDEYGGLKWFMDDESSFLPECPYHGLQLGELIDTNKNVQVRKGIWDGKPAVYKTYECVETEDLEDARRDICTTLEVLADLKPLQGSCLPIPLAAGSCYGGLLAFICLEDAGPSLESQSTLTTEMKQAARASLRRLHSQRYLHGDVRLENMTFVAGRCCLIDLGQSTQSGFNKKRAKEEISALNFHLSTHA